MGRTVVDEEEERFDAGFSGGAKHICTRADSISENAVEQTMLLNDGDPSVTSTRTFTTMYRCHALLSRTILSTFMMLHHTLIWAIRAEAEREIHSGK